jgi:hypothetical protein
VKATKTLAALAMVSGLAATASAATINVTSNVGTIYQTTSVEEEVIGDEMAGMLVTATVMRSNGELQVITRSWDPNFDNGADHAGVEFGSPDFDLEVEGDTFDNGVWDLDFSFVSNQTWRLISLAFNGAPGNTVFDRCWSGGTQQTNCNNDDGVEGTPGSSRGADFSNFSGWQNGTINVTYSNAVGLNGNAPIGDLFANVLVLFGDGTYGNALPEGGDGDDSYSFRFDTDNARLTQPLATPEPGSMILLGSGLLGVVARMRRKKQ